jgi:hypothetical protein
MPGFSRLQADLEAEPAIGLHYPGGRVDLNRNRPAKVAVAVDRAQLLRRLQPFRGNPPAPHDMAPFHLENIAMSKPDLSLWPIRRRAPERLARGRR